MFQRFNAPTLQCLVLAILLLAVAGCGAGQSDIPSTDQGATVQDSGQVAIAPTTTDTAALPTPSQPTPTQSQPTVAPTETAAPTPLPTVAPAEEPPTAEPQADTPPDPIADLGPPPAYREHLQATDPATVVLGTGKPQMIEFFAFW